MEHQELVAFVIDKIDDLKGRDIITIDVAGKSSVTDTMIICSGNSKRHVVSIAKNVQTEMKAAGSPALSLEGEVDGEWVLVDLGEVVVHVMQDQYRDFYQLEKLWG